MEQTYFRKDFGLKSQVQPVIDAEYHSRLVTGETLARLLAIRGVLPGADAVEAAGIGGGIARGPGKLPPRGKRAGAP